MVRAENEEFGLVLERLVVLLGGCLWPRPCCVCLHGLKDEIDSSVDAQSFWEGNIEEMHVAE